MITRGGPDPAPWVWCLVIDPSSIWRRESVTSRFSWRTERAPVRGALFCHGRVVYGLPPRCGKHGLHPRHLWWP